MQKRKGKFNSFNNKTNARFMQPLIPDFLNSFSIPVSFLKHLELELKGQPLNTVELMTQPQRHWVIQIEGGRYFKDGWPEFCLHHNLGVGDFLVFAQKTHLLFHVSVFDPVTACERQYLPSSCDATGSTKRTLQLTSSSKRKPLKAVAEVVQKQFQVSPVQPQSLSCQITFSAYTFKRKILYLPMRFARSNGLHNRNCDMTIVDGEERHWEVKLSCRTSNGQPYIVQGWKQLQVANCFKPADILTLQVLKIGEKPILKCCSSGKRRESSNFERKPSKIAVAITQASSLQSQSPNCQMRLSSSCIKNNNFYLPRDFAKSCGLANRYSDMTLVDEMERHWKVRVRPRREGQTYIVQGWKDFQAANCLTPGNILSFQLLKAGECPILMYHKIEEKHSEE